jgi:translation initiation factor IF-3
VINIVYRNFPIRPDRQNNDLVNEKIRFPQMLVIDPQGRQLGVLPRHKALEAAEALNLDLLCVAPNANPPVCKILNYGKHRFETQKKLREAKKHQQVVDIKEIQLTPQIGEHDLQVKVKNAIRFFNDGNKVKVVVRYRGRQRAHPELGMATLNRFTELVNEYGQLEKSPSFEGRFLTAFMASKVKK